MHRRKFLQTSLTAAAGLVLGKSLRAAPGSFIYGVQLYMVRRPAIKDLAAALRMIHDAGFAQVELFPIAYNHPPAELRRIIADAGLSADSGHFDYIGLESRLDYARDLGLKFMVCPMLPDNQKTSLQGFRTAAKLFNRAGAAARDRGMELLFHNHDYEFRPIDGSTGFNTLMHETDPALVKLEFDMYWLTQAGQDPVEMLKTHRDRARIIHLKDRLANAPHSFSTDSPQYFTELGRGAIDWKAILLQARSQGIRYAFLDQDESTLPLPESLKISRDYLRTLHV